jgi:polar amino acid transport system permease protein
MLFVEFFRCTPAIVQIVWIFYCVPMLFNVFLGPITMAVLALGMNLMAFNAEAYRASIQAVPKELTDAGIALGLTPLQRTLHIVLPNALRASTPVLLTNGVGIFQQSALVAIVAVQDLMYQSKSLATETYRPIEIFTVTALIYFAVSFPVTQFVGWLERRRQLAMG